MRHLIALLSIFTFLTSSTLHAQVPSYVPTNGLVGWWPFNSNANDESGNGNNGTVNGSLALTTDRNNNGNSAYLFPGDPNSYIDCGNSNSLQIIGEISISAWIYMDGGYIGPRIIAYEASGGGGYGLMCATSSNDPRILYAVYYNADGSGTGFCCEPNSGVGPISALQWHHVLFTANSSGFATYYINGQIAGTFQGPSVNNINYGNSLNIGRLPKPAFDAWGGKLDDLGIWNRALTEQEIQSLYTSQGSSPCVSPTAVSFSGLAPSYTTSDGPATLTGTPAGGVFIGPGVTGSTFSPAVAGEGTHSISYTYLDGDNCVNTSSLCTSVSLGMGLEPGGNAPGGVRVFPNPNRGQFTVELELNGLVGLQVFDARGALVHNEVFTASGSRTQRTLDLSAFAKGSYTLLVEHNGQRVTQAVVVE
jgi:hypothetical protein